jgi:hypothetical protein
MNDEKQTTLDLEHDSLAEPPKGRDQSGFHGLQRRFDRPEHERAYNSDSLNWLSDNARLKRMKIQKNVGELGHGELTLNRIQKTEYRMQDAEAIILKSVPEFCIPNSVF